MTQLDYLPQIKCLQPLRIRNKYTHEYMFVPCHKCDVCKINMANNKAYQLSQDLNKYPFMLFVTLTYENKYLPYMFFGSSAIYRGFEPFNQIGECNERCDTVYPITRFPVADATGVLFKKDLQNFFKRLRINYDRNYDKRFPYKYCAVGEYGTVTKRPHFHVVIYGKEIFPKDFRDRLFESWPFHSWNGFDVDKKIQFASSGISNYISSYISSFFGCGGFFNSSNVKPFNVRSKDIHFAQSIEIQQNFKSAVEKGLSKELLSSSKNPFRFVDEKTENLVSRFGLPKKYLSSLFSLPAGIYQTSFDNQCRCVAKVVFTRKPNDLINSDYNTYLSYEKYCKFKDIKKGSPASLFQYCFDSFNFRNMYHSELIRLSMLEYDEKNPELYFASRVNSFVDNMSKRKYRLSCLGVDIEKFDVSQCQLSKESYFSDYLRLYRHKLLPKHLNNLIYDL